MRRFKCHDCAQAFEVAHGVGGPGCELACPKCGGRNVHRAENDRGFARVSHGPGASSLGRGPRWAQ